MSVAAALKRRWKRLVLIVPVALVVFVVGGTYVYIHFIAPDPAAPLAFSSVDPSSRDASAAPGAVDGTWTVAGGSKVQYRVQEVLNGLDNTATGTSTGVTGTFVITGTTISAASFTVDMTTFSSGESQRDSQFRNRIMSTAQFPTATFELTSPIVLSSIPDNLVEVSVPANGRLTMHGTIRDVTIDLTARRNGAAIEVNGNLPIRFSDYGIKDPSGGPARVGDTGTMELLLIFGK